jgi:DNA helicase-2/ATP-dependent DNA helicase PcrA
MTKANERMLYGRTSHNPQSRFINEISPEFIKFEDDTRNNVQYRVIAQSTRSTGINLTQSKPSYGVSTGAQGKSSFIRFAPGDKVSHFQFGDGYVISVTSMGSDLLYEIEFDKVGKKKMMATFAKLKRGV